MEMQLHIKQGPDELAVTISSTATAGQLKQQLEQLTGIFIRNQKLIFKGKVLSDGDKLADCKISNGAKVMLLQTEGLLGKSQPTLKGVTQQHTTALAASRSKPRSSNVASTAGGSSLLAEKMATMAAARTAAVGATSKAAAASALSIPERRAAWTKTGVIALRDMQLAAVQPEWIEGLSGARAADFSHNCLASLPASLCQLSSLASLKLTHNCLQEDSIPWQQLCSTLTALTCLLIGHNQLTQLPAAVSQLSNLVQLGLEGCTLRQLEASAMAGLVRLETLVLQDNQLDQLPDSIGCCSNLVALNASCNALLALPDSMSQLGKLQVLAVDKNRLTALPAQLFVGCTALATLSAHQNPITVEHLRAMQGYASYESRRQARASKQLEGRVMADINKAFSEGADVEQWQRWAAGPAGLGSDGSGRAGK